MKKIFTFFTLVVMGLVFFTACEKQPVPEKQPVDDGGGIEKPKPDEPEEKLEEYVDLGLSVKWATCNLGATKPEEYGGFFMWGDVDPTLRVYYSWDEYKYCDGSNRTLTKYCYDKNYGKNGFTDDKLVLDASDDAASVILKGKWRMPTAEERDELIDEKKCKWEYVVVNGVKGARITSKVKGYEGRSIFLPATGWQREAMQVAEQEAACYWTSSICTQTQYTDAPSNACALSFSYTQQMNGYAWEKRFYGCCIRPVHP
jgi:hypothetical protein